MLRLLKELEFKIADYSGIKVKMKNIMFSFKPTQKFILMHEQLSFSFLLEKE